MSINTSSNMQTAAKELRKIVNQNIQVYVRLRPLNSRERQIRSNQVVEVVSSKEIVTRHSLESKITKKFTFDGTFGPNSTQMEVYSVVVAPLIDEVIAGYNCTVFAYGQTGTGKTHTMVGTATPNLSSSWQDNNAVGIIPRALDHLFDELRLMEVDFSMRVSYLELYNEELSDLLSTDDTVRVRIFEDSSKKGSVIVQGLEEIPVHSKDDVYKLLEKGQERRKTASTLMNEKSSRSHTVFSILVHIRETGNDGEEMLKIGKLNLVDLAGSENATKAGTDKGIRVREAVNINQSLLTLGRVITALVERTPHIPYRESKLTRLLQESLGGRTKTSIIATISPGHKDIEETLSTLQYADRAKSIQNKPEINQRLTKVVVLKEYSEEIERLKRDLVATRDKNGIYLSEDNYNAINSKVDAQQRELNEKMLLIKVLREEMLKKESLFNDVSEKLVQNTIELQTTENVLKRTQDELMQKDVLLLKTKKRYHEKKTLLQSHVETEQVLTKQAKDILTVADFATNDAEKLHHTIERRQNVDREIETKCNKFSSQMKNYFNGFEQNFEELQQQVSAKFKSMDNEISSNVKRQSEHCQQVESKVNELLNILETTTKETKALDMEVFNTCKNWNENHKIVCCDLLAKQKEIYEQQFQQMAKGFENLLQNNAEQTSVVVKMQATLQNGFQMLTNDVNNFAQAQKQQFTEIFTFIKANLEDQAKIKNHINNEFEFLAKEKTIIDDFMKKMLELKATRTQAANDSLKLTTATEKRTLEMQNTLQNCDDETKIFLEKEETTQKFIKNDMAALFEESQTLNAENVNKTIQINLDSGAFLKENKENIENLIVKENENCVAMELELKKQHDSINNLRNERNELHVKSIETINATTEAHVQQTQNVFTRLRSNAMDLESAIQKYGQAHKQQVDNCTKAIETFQKEELKTYKPTGETPAKRSFVYPRKLAATQPHEQIINRLRKEPINWADLNVTTIIDEDESVSPLHDQSSESNKENISFG